MKTLFDYTLHSFNRFGRKNMVTGLIFTALVWLLSSTLMITHALKQAVLHTSASLPHITLTQLQGGRPGLLSEATLEPLWAIRGVGMVQGRVWGLHYFEIDNVYASIVGVEPYVKNYNALSSAFAATLPQANPPMLTSTALLPILQPYRSQDKISFLRHGGGFETLALAGTFDAEYSLFSNDVIVMPVAQARAILGIQSGFTDAFVHVANSDEVDTIARKIKEANPTLRVLTKEEMVQGYLRLYDYKSGWFLGLMLICFFTFAMLLYDKASGLSSQERKEIGLLKALGWETSHILRHKLTEAALVSMGGFFAGLTLAVWYVFGLDAPLLRHLFTGYGALRASFSLPFHLDAPLLALLFFGTVPLYLAACIVPAWKASIEEAGEIMR